MGSHSLLQEIFPTQGSNPGLLHFRQILYQMSYKGSPSGQGIDEERMIWSPGAALGPRGLLTMWHMHCFTFLTAPLPQILNSETHLGPSVLVQGFWPALSLNSRALSMLLTQTHGWSVVWHSDAEGATALLYCIMRRLKPADTYGLGN